MTTLRDLLINKDSVLILNLDLVDKIGLNEAIFLQQLHYWIEIKQRSAQAGERRWTFLGIQNTKPNCKSQGTKDGGKWSTSDYIMV